MTDDLFAADESSTAASSSPKNDKEPAAMIMKLLGTDPRLATIILNSYSAATTSDLVQGLDTMCAPTDAYGWSSSGVYVFWCLDTKEILYVGLAVDLPLRFRHHNNLASCPTNCCKWSHIQQHFSAHPKLGYSLLVQSPLDQAICDRWESVNGDQLEWLMEEFGFLSSEEAKSVLNKQVDRTLRRTEGAMLAAHVEDRGRLPKWNKIRGFDVNYSTDSLADAREYLKAVTATASRFDPLVARSSLLEMDAKPLWCGYEQYLHGIRILVRATDLPWDIAVASAPDILNYSKRTAEDGYMTKQPLL